VGIPFAITPLGQLYQSPPWPIPEDRARSKRRGLALEPPRATRSLPEFIWTQKKNGPYRDKYKLSRIKITYPVATRHGLFFFRNRLCCLSRWVVFWPLSQNIRLRPLKRSQSPVDMLEHRETYVQAQVCSKGNKRLAHLSLPDDHCLVTQQTYIGVRGYSRRPRSFWRICTVWQMWQNPTPTPSPFSRCNGKLVDNFSHK